MYLWIVTIESFYLKETN